MDELNLEINAKTINELNAIKDNKDLMFKVLLFVGLIAKGMNPSVELITTNDSRIYGEIFTCTGHSFFLGSKHGYIANINFTDIDTINVHEEASCLM